MLVAGRVREVGDEAQSGHHTPRHGAMKQQQQQSAQQWQARGDVKTDTLAATRFHCSGQHPIQAPPYPTACSLVTQRTDREGQAAQPRRRAAAQPVTELAGLGWRHAIALQGGQGWVRGCCGCAGRRLAGRLGRQGGLAGSLHSPARCHLSMHSAASSSTFAGIHVPGALAIK